MGTKASLIATSALAAVLSCTSAYSASIDGKAANVLAVARHAFGWGNGRDGVLIEMGTEKANGFIARWRSAEDLRNGRTHQSSDYGPFRSAETLTLSDDWRQDHSGGVHVLNSDFARQHATTQRWLAQRGFLRKGALNATIDYEGTQTTGGKNLDVVRATPANGQPVDLWFDQNSGLLDRSVWVMPTIIETIRYGDYRPVAGLMLAFHVAVDDGDTRDDDVLSVANAKLAGTISKGEFAPPIAPHDWSIDGGETTVPISFDGDVVVDAMLNGQGPFSFILDTGGHDILTPQAAAALRLNGTGAGSAGGAGAETLPVQYTRIDRLQIGGLLMRDQSFLIIPLQYAAVERGTNPPLAGILGVELFERFGMRLDYHSKTLAFRPLADLHGSGKPVAITFTDDQPLMPAKIDGLAGDNALDTGNSGGLVVQGRWADANGLGAKMRNGFQAAGFGSGGISPTWVSRADVEVAGVSFPQVIARYTADAKGSFSSRTEAGNVGNDILSNFTLLFDYGHDIVWFEPAPRVPRRRLAGTGMSAFKESAEAFTIAAVAPGSPAAEAGLAPKDKIIAIDGTPASKLSGWDLGHIARREPGTKVKFDYLRDGKPGTATVQLRELLP